MGWTGHIKRTEPISKVMDDLFGDNAQILDQWVEGPKWAMNGVKNGDIAKYARFTAYAVEVGEDGRRQGLVALIEADLPRNGDDAVWVTKVMPESMGPTYAPESPHIARDLLRLLQGSDAPGPYGARWRQRLTNAALYFGE